MQFVEYQIFNEKNLLCFQSLMDITQLSAFFLGLPEKIKEIDVCRRKNTLFVMDLGESMIITSVCIPLNEDLRELSAEYLFKPRIHLENAVRCRHEGALYLLPESISQLEIYLRSKSYQTITPIFGNILTEMSTEEDLRDMVIDIFVSIQTNIV